MEMLLEKAVKRGLPGAYHGGGIQGTAFPHFGVISAARLSREFAFCIKKSG